MVPVLDNSRDAAMASNDLRTFRDAAAANLFLMEGLIRTDPDNRDLRINASILYFSYAFAYVEETDSEYASILYQKGLAHGRAAVQRNKRIPQDWDISFDDFSESLQGLKKKDVPAAVWAAANWSQYIALHLDSTPVLRDIPKVASLLERAAELDGDYFQGLVYVMIGSLHSFKPPMMGGSPEKSRENFERAFSISGDSFLLSRYMYAKFYLYRIQDADAFESALSELINRPNDESSDYQLLNLIAQDKAKTLLGEKDELF